MKRLACLRRREMVRFNHKKKRQKMLEKESQTLEPAQKRRTYFVYAALAAFWMLLAGWQFSEHTRIREMARDGLRNHARDIANSLSVVIRSQGRFGMAPRERLDAALQDLTESGELRSVALLNASGEITASAGEPLGIEASRLTDANEHWSPERVTFVTLVALGSNAGDRAWNRDFAIMPPPPKREENGQSSLGSPPQPSGMPRAPQPHGFGDSQSPNVQPPGFSESAGRNFNGHPRDFHGNPRDSKNTSEKTEEQSATPGDSPHGSEDHPGPHSRPKPDTLNKIDDFVPPWIELFTNQTNFDAVKGMLQGDPLTEEQSELLTATLFPPIFDDDTNAAIKQRIVGNRFSPEMLNDVLEIARKASKTWPPDPEDLGHGPGRPPWLSEAQYDNLISKRGVHWFALTMSTQAYQREADRDFRLRIIVGAVGLLAMLALAFAWRTAERSAGLRLRLVRAGEMNIHLQEMNLAAAGLAHETKNPLNIVRGRAQMITQNDLVPKDIRATARGITEEVDRVTERLNRFLDYSRPLKVIPAPVALHRIMSDVARVLEDDRSEKQIEFTLDCPEITILADEALLRQVIFNLLLNAAQAVPLGGRIQLRAEQTRDRVCFEVEDNGPGVPEELREDIFRPYFTTSPEGTGLGLAVVRQMALAHQWEIQYRPAPEKGACFRVCGLKPVSNQGTQS